MDAVKATNVTGGVTLSERMICAACSSTSCPQYVGEDCQGERVSERPPVFAPGQAPTAHDVLDGLLEISPPMAWASAPTQAFFAHYTIRPERMSERIGIMTCVGCGAWRVAPGGRWQTGEQHT